MAQVRNCSLYNHIHIHVYHYINDINVKLQSIIKQIKIVSHNEIKY